VVHLVGFTIETMELCFTEVYEYHLKFLHCVSMAVAEILFPFHDEVNFKVKIDQFVG